VTDFSIEHSIKGLVIGLDEVGRGPLAGPVISCGVMYNSYQNLNSNIPITDSKKLSKKQRKELFEFFRNLKKENILEYHLGLATVEEIDKLNILGATKLSMKRVIDKFSVSDPSVIIDGNFKLNYNQINERSIIGGDNISISIATASIIAKVHRDRLMGILDSKYKYFGWKQNAGYGTKKHIEAIKEKGVSNFHRKTFEPIKSLIKIK
jgi:Ribonuclease HII